MNNTAYILAIHSLNRLSAMKITAILDYFAGDAEVAWHNRSKWHSIVRLTADLRSELESLAANTNPEQLYLDYLAGGAAIATIDDENYPTSLRDIHDPPFLLFYKGELPDQDELTLAMIGSRQATPYGRQVADVIARDLAYQGICVVSGMARGIDSFCHKAALAAGGRTVAVLGSGIDVIYPRENSKLYQQIAEQGAVISEFPMGMAALAYNFPRRNRIISGLSKGVVVIEANEKSGTLRTVDFGLEQGKDIFAVPGSIISPASRGTNRLLREGAKIVLSAEDIWREYLTEPKKISQPRKQKKSDNFSPTEKKLIKEMMMPVHFDRLLTIADLDAAKLASLLTVMEIRGLIRQLPGKYYQTIVKNI